MPLLGPDFRGGAWRRLYDAPSPGGLWRALGFAAMLIIVNQLLQLGFAAAAAKLVLHASLTSPAAVIKSYMIGLFPASLATAALAWVFARSGGRNAPAVLGLRRPRLGALGWTLLILSFLVALYGLIFLAVKLLGIDLGQYAPTEGEDHSRSIGLVKQAMFDLAHDPRLFLLVLPSVTIGAPLAEELVFRGQLFNALSHTRLGISGATLATAGLWALMHISEPLLSMAMIFMMGLAFGYILYRFGSLWVTIACHAVWNSIYSLVIFGSIQS